MRYAVVLTGGKQYLALEGQALEVDRIPTAAGEPVELAEVLLIAEDDRIQVGKPTLAGAKVHARVVSHLRGPKVRVFKYRPKKRTRKRQGHRQSLTRILIDEIRFPGSAARAERAAAPESPKEGAPPPKPKRAEAKSPKPASAKSARPAAGRAKPAGKTPARGKRPTKK